MKDLRLIGLRKAYGGIEVIRGVDLEVARGEFCVFVGPSGCGKSTLLRMIAGLEEITGGDLLIGGQRMNEVDASRRGIAMVFQSYALYPHMTVRENMGFALRFAGVPAAEIRARVDEAAAVLGLDRLMERRPKDLSGGQRQRVAIGRAIVRKPEVFLFDEPLSNLDAELRVNMRIEIARLHRDLGATIVYVTHDQVEAMTLADKIVVLRDGRVEQVGSPLQLYDDPDNLFVAGFIGSPRMNLLPAMRLGDQLVLDEFDGQSLAIPPLSTLPVEGEEITVGIRPTVFRGSGTEGLSMTAEIVEHLGAETLVHARPRGSPRLVTIQRNDARNILAGQPIDARFDIGSVIVFRKDGRRLR